MAVVLITGCSSGFGKLAALAFARQGHTVFASMRNLDKAPALRDEARAAGLSIEIIQMDVNDTASVENAVATVLTRAGRIDVLVNNAGIGAVAALEDFDDDEILRVFETNLFGAIRVTRAVTPHMRAQKSGRLVHVGSLAAVVPAQFRGVYAASKSALAALSDSLFYELHPWNIHSCVVEPGFFETAIGDNRMRTRRQSASDYAPLLDAYEGGASSAPVGSERADPTPVAEVIVQAATEVSPRRHYLVGKDAEALSALKARLPDDEFAKVVLRTMPALDENQ
jgi:NAD(P)-dependent dehydrogenase (short-subunit alcohol dehydrogenase family)